MLMLEIRVATRGHADLSGLCCHLRLRRHLAHDTAYHVHPIAAGVCVDVPGLCYHKAMQMSLVWTDTRGTVVTWPCSLQGITLWRASPTHLGSTVGLTITVREVVSKIQGHKLGRVVPPGTSSAVR